MSSRGLGASGGLAAAILACLTGCIPVPFVLPPIKAESGVSQPMVAADVEGPASELVGSVASYRLGVFPMGLVPSAIGRRFDIGGGVIFDDAPVSVEWERSQGTQDIANVSFHDARHTGAFVEGHYWLKVLEGPNSETAQRIGLVFDAQYLEPLEGDAGNEPGYAGSVGIEFESALMTAFAFQGSTSEAAFMGVAAGEMGYSVGAKVSYHNLGHMDYWSTVLTCSVRFPASAGLLLIPLPLD